MLYRDAEIARARAIEEWYSKLPTADRTAIDAYCLNASEPVLGEHFPPDLQGCLRAPLSRLAVEYAGIVRRAATLRQATAESCALRRLNYTVLPSLLNGLRHEEEQAKTRVIGTWFREHTPDLVKAFDGTGTERPLKPKRTRGNPGLDEKTRREMVKEYGDYKASGLTQREYLKQRGLKPGINESKALRHLERCRKHWAKSRRGM